MGKVFIGNPYNNVDEEYEEDDVLFMDDEYEEDNLSIDEEEEGFLEMEAGGSSFDDISPIGSPDSNWEEGDEEDDDSIATYLVSTIGPENSGVDDLGSLLDWNLGPDNFSEDAPEASNSDSSNSLDARLKSFLEHEAHFTSNNEEESAAS